MHNNSKEFLEQVTTDHPYFSVGQFNLLQQMDTLTPNYAQQAAKTALFFNNSYWLNFQLEQKKQEKEIISEPVSEMAIEKNTDNNDDKIILKTEAAIVETNNADNDDDAQMEPEIEPIKLALKLPEEHSKGNDLLFEPMHLVDYFASQGIKLSDEVQPTDKLGKQMKSFTEWLKTMKKIHPPGAEPQNTAVTINPDLVEKAIQTLAEKSNSEDEILTESMADVLGRQGKLAKAAELYQKLSLLNPSKSAYFAAKIENLKGL